MLECVEMQIKYPGIPVVDNQAERLLPQYVTDEKIEFWKKNGFALHYLPPLNIIENKEYSLTVLKKESLIKTIPETQSYFCPGRWVLVEKKKIVPSKVPWINSQDIYLLTILGLKMKSWLQKHTVMPKQTDSLEKILTKHNQYSRFCMTKPEINIILTEVCGLLKLPKHCHVRLLHYVEYSYLCKEVYPEWATTKTWEWLEDKLDNNRHLATGYKTWNIIGYDPPDFWSTILGFRVVIEI